MLYKIFEDSIFSLSTALMDVCFGSHCLFFLQKNCYIITRSHGIKIMTCLFNIRKENIG